VGTVTVDIPDDGIPAGSQRLAVTEGLIQISGFFYVSGSFVIEKSTAFVTVTDGTSPEVVDVELLTFGATVNHAFAGINGPYWMGDVNDNGVIDAGETNATATGLSLSNLEFALALVGANTGDPTDQRTWVGLDTSVATVEFVGITGLALSGSVGVRINQGFGEDADGPNDSVVDFPTSFPTEGLEIETGGTTSITLAFDGSYLSAVGALKLDLFGFFYVDGTFAFEKRSATVTVTDGTTSEPGVEVEMLKIGATVNHAFAGVNGPYWREDLDGDGEVDDPAETNASALGISLSAVQFALALFSVKADDPATQTDLRNWTGVMASAGDIAFVGIEGLSLRGSVEVSLNQGGGGIKADPADEDLAVVNDTVVDFTASFPSDGLVVETGETTSLTLGFDEEYLSAAGSLMLDVFGFFYVDGSFAFEKTSETVTVTDGFTSEPGVDVEMLRIGATVNHAFAGVNGPYWTGDADDDGEIDPAETNGSVLGFSLSNVEFALALLKVRMEDPETQTDNRNWTAVYAKAGDIAFVGMQGLTIQGSIEVEINTGGGSDTSGDNDTVVDWPASYPADGLEVATGETTSVFLAQDTDYVSAGGSLKLDLFGFFYVDGSFAFEKTSETVSVTNGFSSEPGVPVESLRIGATVTHAFAGVNGPYWHEDTDDDGEIDQNETNSSALGFSLSGVEFALALMKVKAEDPGTQIDHRNWTAVYAKATQIAFVGMEGLIVEGRVEVEINTGGGSDEDGDNDTVVDFPASYPMEGLEVATGPGTSVLLARDTEYLSAGGALRLDLFGFFYVDGSFAFEKTSDTVTVTDGFTSETDVPVEMLSIGATVTHAFAGVNGPYWLGDDNDDGVVDPAETNPAALGFSLSNVSFGLAILKVKADDPETQTDNRNWTAVKAEAGEIAFVGMEGLKISGGVEVEINTGGGSDLDGDNDTVVDWPESFPADGLYVNCGGGKTVLLGQDTDYISAGGWLKLDLFGFFYVDGSFAFEKTSETVTVTDGFTSEPGVDVEMLSIGATIIHAFAGVNGPYWREDIDDDGEVDEATETNAAALGFSLSEVRFALTIMKVRTDDPDTQTDFRSWTAVSAEAEEIAFVGIEDMTLSGSVSVEINTGGGYDTEGDNDTVVDFPASFPDDGLHVDCGGGRTVLLGQDTEYISAGGALTLGLFGFFYLSGSFAFEKTSEIVTVTDGTNADTAYVEVLSVGAEIGHAFAGVNGPYWNGDDDGDGIVDVNETDPDAFGLSLSNFEFALVLMKVRSPDPAAETDLRNWTALSAEVDEVAFVGMDALEISGGATIKFNVGGGGLKDDPADPAYATMNDTVVDFPASFPPDGKYVDTGDASPVLIPFSEDYLFVEVHGMLKVSSLELEGSFAFEKTGDSLGVAADFSIEFMSGTEPVFELSGEGAMLIRGNGLALQIGMAIGVGSSTGPFRFAGDATFWLNTTGEDVSTIAGKSVNLVLPPGKTEIIKVEVAELYVKIGNYLEFSAGDVVLDLTATGTERLVEFGEDGLSLKFGSGIPVVGGWGGSVGNFGIRADFVPLILPGFYASISMGSGITTADFGLPIPIKLTELGIRFRDDAISEEGVLLEPWNFALTISGGLDGSGGFPITAMVDGLEVDIGKLIDGEFPFTKIDGVQFGINDMNLGVVKIGGMFTFGLVDIENDSGETVTAFYGGIEGSFTYSGIGGGIKLYVCQYGPLIATISAGGLVLGPTGFVLGVEDGGFAFGGDPWPSPESPEDLLTTPVFQDPFDTSLPAIKARVEQTVRAGNFTWEDSFTMAATGTITNLYVQGMIAGNVTVAVNIGMPEYLGDIPEVKLLINGTIDVLGMPMGYAGLVIDLTNPIAPIIDFAFSVPAPGNPLAFLFPNKATILARLDTSGIIEMPVVGIAVFIRETFEGVLELVLEDLAAELEANHGLPLAQLMLDIGDGSGGSFDGVVDEDEDEQVITPAFFVDRVIGDDDTGVEGMLPTTFEILRDFTIEDIGRAIDLIILLVPALITQATNLANDAGSGFDYDEFLTELIDVVIDAAIEGIQAGWETFDPSLEINVRIQPTIFGMPMGEPDVDVTLRLDKFGISFEFAGSIRDLLLNVVPGLFGGNIIAAIPAPFQGISDSSYFYFKLDFPEELFSTLIAGLSDPDDIDSQSITDMMVDLINPFTGWEILFTSTITFLGFKLGSVSGFIFGPQDTTDPDFDETTFGQRVVLLDPDGDDEPNQDLIDLYTDAINVIPVNSKSHYDDIVEYGGLLLTGQLYMPDIISDPVAVVTTPPEWAETTIYIDGSEFLTIQAVEAGTNLNNVQIIFLHVEGAGGSETVEYNDTNISAKRLIITMEDGVSTAQDIADAIDAEGTFKVKGINPDDIPHPDAVIDLDVTTVDPTAGGVNGIDWTLPDVDFTDIMKIMDNFTKIKDYILQIIEGLTHQSEWAKLQIYIASPAELFDMGNYLEPGSTRASTEITSTDDPSWTFTVTSREYGAVNNGVTIVFQNGATAGSEEAAYDEDTKTLTVMIQNGVSTSGEVARAINREGTFFVETSDDFLLMTISELTVPALSGGSVVGLSQPKDVDTIGEEALQRLMDILGAGYIEGYSDLRLLGIDLGTTFIEGTINGIRAEADIPWLAGLTAGIETGWKETSVNEIFYYILTSPIASAVVGALGLPDDPAETFAFLLDEDTPDLTIKFPVAAFEAMLSSEHFLEWLVDNFGLPEQIVAAASSVASHDFFFGAYTPGYGEPEDSGVKRNGGFRFEGGINIEGLVEDAWFEFEIEFFNPFENTDGITFFIPNFVARASVQNLSLPGFTIDSNLFTLSDFLLEIVKDKDAGLSFNLVGTAFLFGLRLDADGEFTLCDEGMWGGLLLDLSTGVRSHTQGGSDASAARALLRSPGLDNDVLIQSRTERANATIISTEGDFEILIQAVEPGTYYNGVTFWFENGGTAGEEVAVFDDSDPLNKVLRITVEDGVSTAADVAVAIMAEGTFTALCTDGEDVIDMAKMNPTVTAGGASGNEEEWATATVRSRTNDLEITLEADASGEDWNGVHVIFVDAVKAGEEVAYLDTTYRYHHVLYVLVDDGVSTAGDIAAAIEAEGSFHAWATDDHDVIDIASVNPIATSGWTPGTAFDNIEVMIIDDGTITDGSASAGIEDGVMVIRIQSGVTRRSAVVAAVGALPGWACSAHVSDGAADGRMVLTNKVNDLFGFELEAQFILLLNISDDTRYVTWNVEGADEDIPIDEDSFLVHADGYMTFLGIIFDGTFDFVIDDGALETGFDASLVVTLDPDADPIVPLFEFDSMGALLIDSTRIAGILTLSVDFGCDLLDDLGIGLSAKASLEVNTHATAVVNETIGGQVVNLDAGPYFRFEFTGIDPGEPATISALGNSLDVGLLYLEIAMTPGGDLVAEGGALGVGVSIGGSSKSFANAAFLISTYGLAVYASIDADDLSLGIPRVEAYVTATLEVNTTGDEVTLGEDDLAATLPAGTYFRFTASGAFRILDGNGNVIVEIVGNIDLEIFLDSPDAKTSGGADGSPGTKASLAVAIPGDDNDLVLTADASGAAYNGVSITFIDDPNAASVGVEYDDSDPSNKVLYITIVNGTSTADDVVTAVNGKPSIPFTASLGTPDNSGSGNTGDGVIELDGWYVDFHVDGLVSLSPLGSIAVEGDFIANGSGVVAALQMGGGTSKTLSAYGFNLSGIFQLELNTRSSAATIQRRQVDRATGTVQSTLEDVTIPAYSVRVFMGGQLTLGSGFSIKGSVELSVSAAEGFSVSLDATATVFGARLDVIGNGGIYGGSDPGIALNFTLTLGGSSNVGIHANGFHIQGQFTLQFNTCRWTWREGVRYSYFQISVANAKINILGFVLSGTVNISYNSGIFRIDVPSSDPLTFKILSIFTFKMSGYLQSNGLFEVSFRLDVTLLDPNIVGARGSLEIRLSHNGFYGYFDGGAYVLGIRLFGLTGHAYLTSTQCRLDLAFTYWAPTWDDWTRTKTAYINVVLYNLTQASKPPPPPPLATRLSDGTLRLNIGVHASYRGSDGITNEVYYISHVSGIATNETIRISALGYVQDYPRITKIWAQDAGSGEDTIVLTGVLCPIDLTGGDGNDELDANGSSGAATLRGGAGDDILAGGSGHDTLAGGPGTDELTGGAGNDILKGDDGNDAMDGGAGNDGLEGGGGDDRIYGQADNDTLSGGAGNDGLYGGDGNDSLTGGSDNDTLEGGAGNDTYAFADGWGADTVAEASAAGYDTMTFAQAVSPISAAAGSLTVTNGGNVATHADRNVEALVGGAGSDVLKGPDATNVWDLTSTGGALNGWLSFSSFERLDGGTGHDTLMGHDITNAWRLTGDNAGTVNGVLAFTSMEHLTGGSSSDTLHGSDKTNAWCVTGTDRGSLNAVLTFSSFENLTGGAVADTFTIQDGMGISGTIDGGSGVDTLDMSPYTTPVTIDLGAGTATGTGAIVHIENAIGGSGDDTISGDDGDNLILGGAGDDGIHGGDGDDVIYCGEGDDVAFGDDGDDSVFGDEGDDRLTGGDDDDSVEGGDGDDVILGDRGHFGSVILDGGAGNDLLMGGDGDDEIYCQAGNDRAYGGDGDDTILGGDGADVIHGGQGDDVIFGEGGGDVIFGDDGEAVVIGQSFVIRTLDPEAGGEDTVSGGDGIDLILGGAGDDHLMGDADSD
ncbi:MAG: M10 family metallopeptidase C-terminal domain-containing protein, partial [Thermoplasmata archaeon]|nr:M10 family metallopeptidase C-terminal domain-containing protein [Thermoplasmata archaeon]